MTYADPADAYYVASVITLYLEMPDTPMRVSASDQWLARSLHRDGVPLETVETALLLGSLRRLVPPTDAPACRPSARWPTSDQSSRNSRRIPPWKTTANTSRSSCERCERYLNPIPMRTAWLDSEDFEDVRSYGSSTDQAGTTVVG